jgi:myosin heavy subunit
VALCSKTESAKLALQALCQVGASSRAAAAASGAALAGRLATAWLMLEAFGHAKTLRNANSSRFGSITQVALAPGSGGAVDAAVQAMLLDTSRCVRLPRSERSFHVLYQLCVGSLSPDLRSSLQIVATVGADAFGCLSSSGTVYAEGVDDRQAFSVTAAGLEDMGLRGQARSGIWRLLAAVLHLSNLRFVAIDGGGGVTRIADASAASLNVAASLLGLPSAVLERNLLQRAAPSGAAAAAHRNPTQAAGVRDALAASLYARVFGAVVALVNASLQAPRYADDLTDSTAVSSASRTSADTAAIVRAALQAAQPRFASGGGSPPTVDVIDPHGNENLASNSFHQLCTNYSDVSLPLALAALVASSEFRPFRITLSLSLTVLNLTLTGAPAGARRGGAAPLADLRMAQRRRAMPHR